MIKNVVVQVEVDVAGTNPKDRDRKIDEVIGYIQKIDKELQCGVATQIETLVEITFVNLLVKS